MEGLSRMIVCRGTVTIDDVKIYPDIIMGTHGTRSSAGWSDEICSSGFVGRLRKCGNNINTL